MANGIICKNYAALTDAFSARLAELNTTCSAIDARTGLASGHTSKLLALKPVKRFGMCSLDLLLETLGLRIIVEVDPDRPPLVTEQRRTPRRDPGDVVATRRRARAQQDMPKPPAPAP